MDLYLSKCQRFREFFIHPHFNIFLRVVRHWLLQLFHAGVACRVGAALLVFGAGRWADFGLGLVGYCGGYSGWPRSFWPAKAQSEVID